jgi:hypothetical protein
MQPHRYSNLYTWHKCQKYFELNRIQGIPDGSDKNGDMAFGSAMHLAIEDLYAGGDGHEVFMTYMDTLKDMEYGRLKFDDLVWMGKQFINRFQEDVMKDIVPVHQEVRMSTSYKYGDDEVIEVAGTADVLGTYKGEKCVLDWKTSSQPYDAYKIVTNPQMYLYADMANKSLGFEAKKIVYVVFIKDPKNPRIQVRQRDVTDCDIKKQVDNVLEIFRTIQNTEVFTKNTDSCKTWNGLCPYFERCWNGN